MAKWAIIKDGAVDSVLDRPQKVTIDGITYGSQIFKSWSDAERWAIGIAKVNAQRLISQFSRMAERKTVTNKAIDSDGSTYVAAVISNCATICGKIDGVDTNAKLAALWTEPESGNAPINDWPSDSDVTAYKR